MKVRIGCLMLVATTALLCASCGDVLKPAQRPREVEVPEFLGDTVGQRAVVTGGEPVLVQGVGLVTGLAGTGSTVHPQGLRMQMLKIITGHGVPDAERLLADPETAVVYVSGYIPPGAVEGERFDLVVGAVPGTQTTSLEGGALLAAELARAETVRASAPAVTVLAMGSGELFVSPFVVEDRPASGRAPRLRPIAPDSAPEPATSPNTGPERRIDPRTAWVLGGGRTLEARRFFLHQLDPSERTAQQIVRHINARFPGAARGNIDPAIIDLKVPAAYAEDKSRFLDVVGAVYLVDSPDRRERRMRELVERLRTDSDRRPLVAALEAFGKPVAKLLEPLLADDVAAVRFHAALVLARLDEAVAVETLGEFVRDDGSPYQEAAISALALITEGPGAVLIRSALDAANPAVRVAAYKALRRTAPQTLALAQIHGRMELAAVPSKAQPFMFVGRQLTPRAVAFGDVKLRPPLLVDTPRFLATARDGDTRVTLVNKRWGVGDRIETSLSVVDVAAVMAGPPQVTADSPRPKALDLSYSDVVAFLDQAFRNGALKARIIYEPVEIPAPMMEQLTAPTGPESDIIIPPK